MKHRHYQSSLALIVAASLLGLSPQAMAKDLHVAYAGSMGTVMDLHLGPAFAKAHSVHYQGEGQGAYGLARLIAAHKLRTDVFVSITPGPIEVLIKAGLVKKAFPVASTAMCIAYSPNSPYAKDFKEAAEGKVPWYEILKKPGVIFGRTDPKTDPQGQNIVFTFMLAERYYHQPDLVNKILGPVENPRQIFTEASLLSRLKSGQMAASSGYLSAVKSLHLPYITLPDQINLSNPAMVKDWYSKVHFTLNVDGKPQTVHTQPLVFYAAVPVDAPDPKLGMAFIHFMTSPQGQTMFKETGYNPPKGDVLK
ncbi:MULTISPECIES: extracellular solute-binding protein [Acidithiobacillus]|uniref:ABC transporter, periplasmic substrate-binding protein, putative n=2 Tax=Acidithiobacillus ferrooxidans TaxID=920 RepID=B7JA75_ACIF2|nr:MULTISPECIES: extracellular solute-binding protein [Acidithiobacillus]MBN6746552.1 substrate-binding domain-containing protein [Acidithiobacillus sp. PG05]MCL4525081.1 extracellular solute-binding protein [Gammaproteobacteria bacterium]ACH83454.1 extracellular solute-binding protein family 1 [Acidithiobacillus ferrooxidans ATCC 53993]ACK79964.1 ABC transporter, periplasmic substrate-binding protein, putative [Acidithiobacillus ferrooxidans ATCC 23270]MBN6743492.1 substrate-binding domain-co